MKRSKRIEEFMTGTAAGGSPAQPFMITQPLIIMFEQDKKTVCHIHPAPDYDHKAYGLLICDLVRHVANAFSVNEEDVWEWVDKERRRPTTKIERPS